MTKAPKSSLFMADRHMTGSSIHIVKTHFLSRSDSNKASELLATALIKKCKDRGIKLSYDVTYGGHPDELHYSEFFAGLGGIKVSPCAGELVRLMYAQEYDKTDNIDFATYLGDDTYDKYLVHDYDIKPMRGLIILPGSNLLIKLVDKEKLNAAVILGATIKPHPLTNKADIEFLTKEYGGDVVMPKMYSGYKAMFNSNVLYATGSTELALYGMLLGKRVINISTNTPVGGYMDAFHHTVDSPDQKAVLNNILNSPYSGIIMHEDGIDVYLDLYQEMLKKLTDEEPDIPRLSKHDVT